MADLAEPREITPVRFFKGVESPFVRDTTMDLRPNVQKVVTVNPGDADPTGFTQAADEAEAERFAGASPDMAMPTTKGGTQKVAAKD